MATEIGYDDLSETDRQLRAVLRPVEPSPLFTESVRLRLARAARKEPSAVQIAASGERQREVLVGAALLSVAGALMYLWRNRTAHSTTNAVLAGDGQVAGAMPSSAA